MGVVYMMLLIEMRIFPLWWELGPFGAALERPPSVLHLISFYSSRPFARSGREAYGVCERLCVYVFCWRWLIAFQFLILGRQSLLLFEKSRRLANRPSQPQLLPSE